MASCAKCGKNPGAQGAIAAGDAAMVVGPAALLGLFGAGALCCSNAACGKVFCDGCANGFVKKSCPSCGNNLSSDAPSGGGGGVSSKDLEAQTDRVVDAIGETTEAVRETTAAVKEQTAVIASGFAATVGELKAQTGLLGNINDTMTAAVGELQGIREDMYANTKNREAIEAKSKLERAEQLLSSDLPEDAYKLICEAVELNPADFSVWVAKVNICQLAALNGGAHLTEDAARSEGSAALERAVKLFPPALKGKAGGLRVAGSLIGASLVLLDESGFERAVSLYSGSVDEGGANVALCEHAGQITNLLDSAQQVGSGDVIAGAASGLLTRAADSAKDSELPGVAGAWSALEEVREGIGADIASAMSKRITTSVSAAKSAGDAAIGKCKADWPKKETVEGVIKDVEGGAGGTVTVLKGTAEAVRGAADRYPDLAGAVTQVDGVASNYDPAAWRSQLAKSVGPVDSGAKVKMLIALSFAGMWLVVGLLLLLGGVFEPAGAMIFMGLIALAIAQKMGLSDFLKARKASADERTGAVLKTMSDAVGTWGA